MKMIIDGNVVYSPVVDYSEVEEITGYLNCDNAESAAFPALRTIGRNLHCYNTNNAKFPKLKVIGGSLYCYNTESVKFPELRTIGWYLDCRNTNNANFSQLREIVRGLDCSNSKSATFPKLVIIGGYLRCYNTKSASFPKLKAITGYLDCPGAKSAEFPNLKAIGGLGEGADIEVSFPKLEDGAKEAKAEVIKAFKEQGFLFADEILARIKSTRAIPAGTLYTIEIIGKTKKSYCIESDGIYSHGDTIKEAKDSFLYKIGDRDKSEYEDWRLDTKVTKKKAIESYRVITGACEGGVREFIKTQNSKKRKYTVGEIIKITKGQFGNEEYSSFFG